VSLVKKLIPSPLLLVRETLFLVLTVCTSVLQSICSFIYFFSDLIIALSCVELSLMESFWSLSYS